MPHALTSYEHDSETQNEFAMARYDVSRLGRFSSPDPIAGSTTRPQSMNRYAYAGNDPVNFADPSGLVMVFRGGDDSGGGDYGFDPTCGGQSEDWGFGVLPGPCPNYPTNPTFPGDGRGLGGGGFDRLKSRALVALLNPDCASLFGGFVNAVTALFSSTYDTYTAGEANPYPDQISGARWANTVPGPRESFRYYGFTFWSPERAGGHTFFTSIFSQLEPGFAPPDTGYSYQMTGFLHELEHTANQNRDLDKTIDGDYPADYQKINSHCSLKKEETTDTPLPSELTHP
jgi:RHS repeat-associated protein